MKKITFDEEEMFVIAVFNPDTRSNTIHIMSEVLPELKDDQDMFDLLLSAMEKLKRISDDEYKKMDLSDYRDEIEWAIEEEGQENPEEEGLQKEQGITDKPQEQAESDSAYDDKSMEEDE
jgi:hypothetical protein